MQETPPTSRRFLSTGFADLGPKAILSGSIPVNGHSIVYVPIEERCDQARIRKMRSSQ
jgi:hypothetical protein